MGAPSGRRCSRPDQAYGIVPYGTEAMHVLRAEKGYIIVGQETDGTATPDDVGLGWAIGKTKTDFVGKRSLALPAMSAPDRKQLVGLLTVNSDIVLEEGAQLVADPQQPVPMTQHRARDVVVLEPRARAFDRARHGQGRAQPDRRDAACADAATRRSP